MTPEDRSAPIAWPLALASAAVLGTLATACMMPFVGIATLAAATMNRAQAVTAMIGVWAANQLLGFGWLGFPLDDYALRWGAALGVASVAALFSARRIVGQRSFTLGRLALAFVAAFAVYEGLLFAFALVAGGTDTFTPAIVARIFANDIAWLVGLAILHLGLTRVAPRVFGATPALRFSR